MGLNGATWIIRILAIPPGARQTYGDESNSAPKAKTLKVKLRRI